MSKLKLLGFSCMLALAAFAAPAFAQYMYLDANGDGVNTSADSVRVPGQTTLDVWLRTDQNRDGSPATCAAGGTPPLAFSYDFNLLATGGTVSWGTYTNNVTTFTPLTGVVSDSTHFYAGYAGSAQLSPGLYKLGTLKVLVTSGRPMVAIVAENPSGPYWTMFGSTCGLGQSVDDFQLGTEWFDVDGLAASNYRVPFTEDFENVGSPPALPSYWDTHDDNPTLFLVPWGVTSSSCGSTAGNYSATVADHYCNDYELDESSVLVHKNGLPLSRYLRYYISFVEHHDLAPGDVLNWFYSTGVNGSSWVDLWEGSVAGTSANWNRRTLPVVDNTDHSSDYLRPMFEFDSQEGNSAHTYHGCYVDSIQVFGIARPDLVASPLDYWEDGFIPGYTAIRASGAIGSPPYSPAITGRPWYLTYRLGNGGDTLSGAFTVNILIDNVFVRSWPENGIAANGVHLTRDIPMPAFYGTGSHSVRLVIDALNQVDESAANDSPELNNSYSSNVVWNAPDLSVQSMSIYVDGAQTTTPTPATLKMGQSIRARVVVKNTGIVDIPSSTPFVVAWYRNLASPPNQTQAYDSLQTVSSLAAGATANLDFVTTCTNAGLWNMYALVDRNNSITEANEGNNSSTVQITWAPKTIVVTGKFLYSDSLVTTDSTYACTNVVLYGVHGTNKPDSLANAFVYQDGHFILGPIVNEDPIDHGFRNLFVRVMARSNEACWDSNNQDNWYLKIWNLQNDSLWSYDSPTLNTSLDTLPVGTLKPTDYGRRAAFHMLRALTDWGWSWIRPRVPVAMPIHPVRVYWAPGLGLGVTQYISGSPAPPDSAIYVNGSLDSTQLYPDEYDDSVLLHEYAHHLAYTFGFDTMTVFSGHSTSVPLPLVVAWEEGWADFFSGWKSGNQYAPHFGEYVDYGRGPGGTLTELEEHLEPDSVYVRYPNLNAVSRQYCTAGSGSAFELEVAGTLWDIYDDHVDTPVGQQYPDSLADGFDPIWNALLGTSNRAAINSVNAFEAVYESTAAVRDKDYRRYTHARWVFIQHGIGGALTGVGAAQAFPLGLRFLGGRPNPFNPETKLRFTVFGAPTPVPVTVRVFDVSGRLVRTVFQKMVGSGTYDVVWDGESGARMPVSSGVYFCEVECQGTVRRTKLVLVR